MREVTERFRLPPGNYLLVPTTFQPHHEADFLIRLFSEKKAGAIEMGNTITADLPEPPKPNPPEEETDEEKSLRRLFEQVAGSDKAISARELQHVLNNVLSRRKELKFDGVTLDTCISIINLMDVSSLSGVFLICEQVDGSGMLEFAEFKVFWDKLKKWMTLLHLLELHVPLLHISLFLGCVFCAIVTEEILSRSSELLHLMWSSRLRLKMLFLSYDTDRSGTMSTYELRSVLGAAGMKLNNKILQLIALRFGDEKFEIDFDDYLTCIVRLENMFRIFQAFDTKKEGCMSLNIQQVILPRLPAVVHERLRRSSIWRIDPCAAARKLQWIL
ncbi:hypothetical protein DNTS_030213 [Danionella cerebrum]|uniref:EF-hand domain-containing protein n=1 Tax=Danionella cerebrum TaxID=2873325 RepID=A0A553Q8A3_9TELE|nr:hypothetical protein DNTS_030213 [Danionella translucida]